MRVFVLLFVGLLVMQQNIVLATLSITTIAGQSGEIGDGGDGGYAIHAHFSAPSGVAVDSAGNIYVADKYNFKIRKIEKTTGLISTFAGTGEQGSKGDGNAALAAQLDIPEKIAMDKSSNSLYICEQRQNTIRIVRDGIITTYVGDGTQGAGGDGGAASSAQLNDPSGLSVSTIGNLPSYTQCIQLTPTLYISFFFSYTQWIHLTPTRSILCCQSRYPLYCRHPKQQNPSGR